MGSRFRVYGRGVQSLKFSRGTLIPPETLTLKPKARSAQSWTGGAALRSTGGAMDGLGFRVHGSGLRV